MGIILSLGLANCVFAAPTDTTITIPATDNHTYAVYQIYTGELDNGVLSNVHYGKSAKYGTEGDLVPKSELDEVAAITGTDAEKAVAIAAYADLTGAADYTVSNAEPLTVPTGYYLIKDNATVGEGDEATLYILQVVGPTTITRKAGTTTSDKTVTDKNDSDSTAELNATGTSADYDIGDAVPYQVKATLSEKVFMYEDFYKVEFIDTLEAGRFSAISDLAIKVNGTAIGATDDYNVDITGVDARSASGFDVTIVFTPKSGKNLASLNNAVITIDFTATLGEGAQIGGDGNDNTLKLKYSNNPNSDEMGETTEHKVTTFTFQIVVDKVDGNNAPLANAGFTLYKVSKADAAAGVTGADAAAKNAAWAAKALADKGTHTTSATTPSGGSVANEFKFAGLDDGYYVLCETTTPPGYNTIDPQVFKVEATHSDTAITSLTGTKLDGSTITFTPDTSAGSLTATIQNNQGATLPSTGGMGTTMIYIIGAILLVGAGILLITKKRMSAE